MNSDFEHVSIQSLAAQLQVHPSATWWITGSLEEDVVEIRGLFGFHFQNNFSPYALIDSVVVTNNSCYLTVPYKVSIRDEDRLDNDFTKDELFASLCSMKNWKSSGMDVSL